MSTDRIIYLDNAATSHPKPPSVAEAVARYMDDIGATPGRSSHRLSSRAGKLFYTARQAIAELFHAHDPLRIVFTGNTTQALNLAICGMVRTGEHVITTSMEHSSVMRPLKMLSQNGVEVSVVQCSPTGELDPADIKQHFKQNTSMVIVNHASNVTGTIQPLAPIGEMAREHGALFLVDTAQTAGAMEINMEAECIDLLAFAGHKALFGPQGTGGLVVGCWVDETRFAPPIRGGTSSRSAGERHPDFLPDLGESGTPNGPGVAGLLEGVKFVRNTGIKAIREREKALTRALLQGLSSMHEVQIYGPQDVDKQIGVVSFRIEGLPSDEVGLRLDDEFGVLSRIGLHCAPIAHKTIGTFPEGSVRFGLSYLNTPEDVKAALKAVATIIEKS